MQKPQSSKSGSSPRGRGKLIFVGFDDLEERLIPARAGKTLFAWRHWIVGRAHPRAGGENDPGSKETMALPGSSPRGRGKRDVAGGDRVGCGLIPARAGKTMYSTYAGGNTAAHPRAGGENDGHEAMSPVAPGSSPRGRGKPRRTGSQPADLGLIPARAGKTSLTSPTSSQGWAHPRAGGENVSSSPSIDTGPGSSPRGRGKREADDDGGRTAGLIPARAGKTARRTRCQTSSPAHPRAGGENGMTSR